jgi:hypothetical protein
MPAILDHETHRVRQNETATQTPDPPLRVLLEVRPLPLMFAGLWVGWTLLTGRPAPWWVAWGLVFYGGLGAWAVARQWAGANEPGS